MARFTGLSTAQLKALLFFSAVLFVFSLLGFVGSYETIGAVGAEPLRPALTEANHHDTIIKINLNLSPADSLRLLPGIGPVLAEQIVAFRDSAGPFEKPEDIIKVKGIGNRMYEKIRPYVEVSPW
jgi:competence protein ComEA